jgi:hypothetical protein
MNQNVEHLRLLSIFHYVVGGIAVLVSFFPLLYSAMGGCILYAARHPTGLPNNQSPPPPILGWFFIAFVVACIECIFVPFGTILGIFTIIVLSRESVKTLFSIPVEAHLYIYRIFDPFRRVQCPKTLVGTPAARLLGVKGRLLSRAKTPLLVRRALQHSLGIQHEQICFQLFSGMSQLQAPRLPICAFQHFSFQLS